MTWIARIVRARSRFCRRLRRGVVLASVIGCAPLACDDRCLVYEYGPPSLRLRVVDSTTGEPLCSRADYIVSTPRGAAIPHEDSCDWWLPGWAPNGDAGASAIESELVVNLTGYLPSSVRVEIRRNECDEIQEPPLVQVDVEPDPAQ